jgi:hypothetical protein
VNNLKKYLIIGIISLLVITFAGCKIQLRGPNLSFDDYSIDKQALTKTETDEVYNEDKEEWETIEIEVPDGYRYTASGNIKNQSGEGKYIIELYGEGTKVGTYGPVNIGLSETKSFSVVFETESENTKYDSFELKLYAIDYYGSKSLQETVEYSVNI